MHLVRAVNDVIVIDEHDLVRPNSPDFAHMCPQRSTRISRTSAPPSATAYPFSGRSTCGAVSVQPTRSDKQRCSMQSRSQGNRKSSKSHKVKTMTTTCSGWSWAMKHSPKPITGSGEGRQTTTFSPAHGESIQAREHICFLMWNSGRTKRTLHNPYILLTASGSFLSSWDPMLVANGKISG